MQFAYEAITEMGKFLLDHGGICAAVEPLHSEWESEKHLARAERCIGAQYVASLDPEVHGGLASYPQVGGPLLFAAIDPNGRIYLIRTGPLLAFRTLDSGVRKGFERPRPVPLPAPPRRRVPREPPTIPDLEFQLESTDDELVAASQLVAAANEEKRLAKIVEEMAHSTHRRVPPAPDSETSIFQPGAKQLRILPPVPSRRSGRG